MFRIKTNQYLIDFYNHYDEDSRLEPKHGTIEFLTTMRYVEKYLKPGDCVLEIGAGTGRYSHALARQGYKVDAIDTMDNETFALYLKYHFATCERKDLLGVTSHAVDIFKK